MNRFDLSAVVFVVLVLLFLSAMSVKAEIEPPWVARCTPDFCFPHQVYFPIVGA